ncbi:50S ribosomal protein L31 [Candidatus Wolfebacteria bacterium]|nr:50S ribosomal protein L31 [Candidatus Wolfebacteria bacterium]
MKKNIHPTYYPSAKVRCACGNTFEIGSTKPELNVEICHKCHPFYTGTAKIVDIAGRVEKFKSRHAKKSATPVRKKIEKKAVKKAKKIKK